MNVITAIEDFEYYTRLTGNSYRKWKRWRKRAVRRWDLDKKILRGGI